MAQHPPRKACLPRPPSLRRHPRGSGGPARPCRSAPTLPWIPACAGMTPLEGTCPWIPAYAGMTPWVVHASWSQACAGMTPKARHPRRQACPPPPPTPASLPCPWRAPRRLPYPGVTPAKAGVQTRLAAVPRRLLDSRLRGNDVHGRHMPCILACAGMMPEAIRARRPHLAWRRPLPWRHPRESGSSMGAWFATSVLDSRFRGSDAFACMPSRFPLARE